MPSLSDLHSNMTYRMHIPGTALANSRRENGTGTHVRSVHTTVSTSLFFRCGGVSLGDALLRTDGSISRLQSFYKGDCGELR